MLVLAWIINFVTIPVRALGVWPLRKVTQVMENSTEFCHEFGVCSRCLSSSWGCASNKIMSCFWCVLSVFGMSDKARKERNTMLNVVPISMRALGVLDDSP